MINPGKDWFFWAISSKKSNFNSASYNEKEVIGICANNCYEPSQCRHNNAKFDPSKFGNCEIDIYLDLDIHELRMCIVGKKENDEKYAQEAVWYNISNINKSGWVPHFNFDYYSARTQYIQIAKIPVEFYGTQEDIQWNQYQYD